MLLLLLLLLELQHVQHLLLQVLLQQVHHV